MKNKTESTSFNKKRGITYTSLTVMAMMFISLLGGGSAQAANGNDLRSTMENAGNHILAAYVDNKIEKGDSLETLLKNVPIIETAPSGLTLGIVYNPDAVPAFSICGWGADDVSGKKGFGDSQNNAVAYKSPSGSFSPMGINCGAAGANATVITNKAGNITPIARPASNLLEFPAGAATSEQPAPAPVVDEEPAPVVAPKAPAEPVVIPWGGIIITGFIILGLAAAIGLFYSIYFVSRKVRKSAQDSEKNMSMWNALIKRHDKIIKTWASYEVDTVKIIDLPLLADMRKQTTIDLHSAIRQAKALRPSNVKKVSEVSALGSPYANAVEKLETAFHVAETEAKRVGWKDYSVDERKRLQKAKDLLNLAMDPSASDNERQAAYKRMRKELDGLIVVPETNILALEKSIKLMLTDGSSEEPVTLTK